MSHKKPYARTKYMQAESARHSRVQASRPKPGITLDIRWPSMGTLVAPHIAGTGDGDGVGETGLETASSGVELGAELETTTGVELASGVGLGVATGVELATSGIELVPGDGAGLAASGGKHAFSYSCMAGWPTNVV